MGESAHRFFLFIYAGLLLFSAGIWAEGTPETRCADFLYRPGQSESYTDFYRRLRRNECWKEWLVVIYMAADNDLTSYAERDIWEAEATGSSRDVDVIVLLDRKASDGLHYLHIAKNPRSPDYRPALAQYIREHQELGSMSAQQQEELFWEEKGKDFSVSPHAIPVQPEADSGNVQTLTRFLDWALRNYPSRRVLFMLWGHGEGFDAPTITGAEITEALGAGARRSGTSSRQGGFSFDFTSQSHMRVVETVPALREVLRARRNGTAFDIAGSDSCLNQQVEFGREWDGIARFLFGSSTIVQKKGFNYRTLIKEFVEHPERSTSDFARAIPRIYGNSVSAQGANRNYSSYYDPFASLGVWDVPALQTLQTAMNDLAGVLSTWMDAPRDPVRRSDRVRDMQRVVGATARYGGISNDLLNFLQQLEVFTRAQRQPLRDSLQRQINGTRSALVAASPAWYLGSRYTSGLLRTSMGVAVWLPTSDAEFQDMFPRYSRSEFYRESRGVSRWGRFTQRLYPQASTP